jgi:integrase
MKGTVYRRGKSWTYSFDVEPDPLTGKRRQQTKGGFDSSDDAWDAVRIAITEYKEKRFSKPSDKTVEAFFAEWLKRIKYSVKPSMWVNYRDYATHYVLPHIGTRKLQDIDEAVCDALYAHLLTNGRVKGKANAERDRQRNEAARQRSQRIADKATGKKLPGPAGKPLQPKATPPAGLAPKTVINVHRMLHKAFEDAVVWRYVSRNPTKGAKKPRVTRPRQKTWTVEQLQRFLVAARDDRFFALWVLEATTGMRRGELAGVERDGFDGREGTLTIMTTRVVVDGKAEESDGKSENAQRMLALDPLTLALVQKHLEQLEQEKAEFGSDYEDNGRLFCWPDGTLPHPDTITRRFKRILAQAGLPEIRLHDVRHSYVTAGRRARIDWKALSERVGHASVAFTMGTYLDTNLDSDREVAQAIASLILSGMGSTDIPGGRS